MLFNLWAHLSYFIRDFSLYLVLILLSSGLLVNVTYKVFKSDVSQRKKRILLSTVFTIFSLILIFSAFEAYFRYRYDKSDGLGFLKVNQRWQQRHVILNSDFFRDRDFNRAKNENKTRICALGDSITFGGGIKRVEDRFSNLLEQKLQNSNYNVEVYNFGKSGYDTAGEIDVYESKKDLNCDIIVWEYFINDIQPKDASTGTPIIVKNSQRAKILELISSKSFFLDYLYWRFSSVYNKTITSLRTADIKQYNNPGVLEQHKKDIKDFLASLKEEKKKVVTVMFPSIYLLGSNYPTYIPEMMGNYFRENGAEVIDLLPYLRGKNSKQLMASRFDTHPNEYVHSLVAEKLFEKVAPLLERAN